MTTKERLEGTMQAEFDKQERLRKAAPELLEVLQLAEKILEGSAAWLEKSGQPRVAKGVRDTIITVNKAIAKAEE